MRVWNLSMFLLVGIIILPCPVLADNSWSPADGNQCNAVCRKAQKYPVAVGRTTGADESFVCSAEGATGSQEPGLRAGFAIKKEESDTLGCAIYTENGGRIAPAFSCLCVDLPVR